MNSSERMPAIFFGHGNPMNAIQSNQWTEAWSRIGKNIRRPAGIVCISAHWYLPETLVHMSGRPRTIHDFGGFPPSLFEVQYPAPGSPSLARRIMELLHPIAARPDESWGLDHGAWSVLCHLFPDAAVPVVQVSIDETQPAQFHYQAGRLLAPLRDEGVLVMGSGNLVHNLHAYAWGQHPARPFDWTLRFDKFAREKITEGDDAALVNYESLGADAALAAPTPDHFLPLLYVLGTRMDGDGVSFPVEGIDGGSISMLSVQLG
ncbi:MAG: 4,5-DOPA dioxygenase extradiol [Acidobacteriota bacterium]